MIANNLITKGQQARENPIRKKTKKQKNESTRLGVYQTPEPSKAADRRLFSCTSRSRSSDNLTFQHDAPATGRRGSHIPSHPSPSSTRRSEFSGSTRPPHAPAPAQPSNAAPQRPNLCTREARPKLLVACRCSPSLHILSLASTHRSHRRHPSHAPSASASPATTPLVILISPVRVFHVITSLPIGVMGASSGSHSQTSLPVSHMVAILKRSHC